MSFLRLISIADILTLGNAICGTLAIVLLHMFQPDITLGSSLIIVAMIFDGLDGLAARKFGTKHNYGKYLDSIADAISFGIAPAFMFFIIFKGSGTGSNAAEAQILFVTLAAILTAGFAIYRLTKFSFEGYKFEHFSGLATPAFAFLIIITSHILDPHRHENDLVAIPFFAAALVIMGNVLLISDMKYPKVRGKTATYVALSFIVALASLIILRFASPVSPEIIFIYYRILSFLALVMIIVYMIFGPLYLKFTETKNAVT